MDRFKVSVTDSGDVLVDTAEIILGPPRGTDTTHKPWRDRSAWRCSDARPLPGPGRSSWRSAARCSVAIAGGVLGPARPPAPGGGHPERDAAGTLRPRPETRCLQKLQGWGVVLVRVLRDLGARRLAVRARPEPRPGEGPDQRRDRARQARRPGLLGGEPGRRRLRELPRAHPAGKSDPEYADPRRPLRRDPDAEPDHGLRRTVHRACPDLRAERHLHDDRAGAEPDARRGASGSPERSATSRSTTSSTTS